MERKLTSIVVADVVGYSRLMARDEAGTLAAIQGHRAELIEPAIDRHRGRVVKLMGDGMLVEFASVVEAVACAVEIQRGMADRNAGLGNDRRMDFRIGVHLGDVIVDGSDIQGDGVNIAARLERIAATGGICISRQAFDQIENKLPLVCRSLGRQSLRNIPHPVEVYRVELGAAAETKPAPELPQEIRYCRAPDGVHIAYTQIGHGPPLVRTGHWMSHLEFDWDGPIFGHLLHGLARHHTLLRYDARGNGLSDWEVDEISFDAWVGDLESVVDAAGLTRFPLLGMSQGCAVSIAYAVRHPERVSHLILFGGFALGGNKVSPEERARRDALGLLMRTGWGADNPAFRQIFTSQFMPEATKEQADWFNELQRRTTSPEGAFRYWSVVGNVDVRDLCAKVTAPTLVLHVRDDARVPIAAGRQMASLIPGARFVTLPGKNHMMLEGEPAAARFFEELERFLAT
jgi:class 3 adenylate cyclase/pimeloyl-ACP methyl ester carboxylesterase